MLSIPPTFGTVLGGGLVDMTNEMVVVVQVDYTYVVGWPDVIDQMIVPENSNNGDSRLACKIERVVTR